MSAAGLATVLPAVAAPPLAAGGEVIVGFKPGAEALRRHPMAERVAGAEAQRALQQRAERLATRLGRPLRSGAALGRGVQLVQADGLDAETLARRLAADPDVAYAQPNGRKRLVAAPNDPLYAPSATERRSNGSALQDGPASGQWYLRAPDATVRSAIDIEAAWARTRGSASVVVAVLDTGVRFEHPDLSARLLPGYDFVTNATVANDGGGRDADPSDPGDWVTAAEAGRAPFTGCEASNSSWHGTATSSLVGATADNGNGMAGAAPGVRVLPVRVLGKCFGNDADIIAGMRWAAGLPVDGVPANPTPARVLNLSLGGGGACGAAYQAAVDEITARGVLVIAAAGNTAGGAVNEPANCRGVLGVLALRHAGTKVGFSDLGPEIGISAPGGNCINITRGTPCLYPILAATNTGSNGPVASSWSDSFRSTVGTSFSSPLVAAVAALLISADSSLGPAQLTRVLQASSREFPMDGADNGPGDPTPVAACRAPSSGTEQLQCYCPNDGTLCGQGMLDAGAAMRALSEGVAAKVRLRTASPVERSEVVLESASYAVRGDRIVGFAWSVVDGGGVVARFNGSLSGSEARLTPTGPGRVKVRLAVVGDQGDMASRDFTFVVGAAPPAPPATAAPPESGGGGGASSPAWIAGLALAVAVLLSARRRRP